VHDAALLVALVSPAVQLAQRPAHHLPQFADEEPFAHGDAAAGVSVSSLSTSDSL
jgi:hypothetical protein